MEKKNKNQIPHLLPERVIFHTIESKIDFSEQDTFGKGFAYKSVHFHIEQTLTIPQSLSYIIPSYSTNQSLPFKDIFPKIGYVSQ